VVWAGVSEGADRLTRLAGRVESALSRVGFPKEKRSFSAHLTLGRVRSPKNTEALVVVLSEYHAEKFGTLEATEFQLMQSELRPTGSVYTMLERFPLEARERGETLEERHAG
jgi:2'-5' RNA ligase